MQRCRFEKCHQPANGGKWCYYHAKMTAGMLDPHPESVRTGAYDRRLLDRIERETIARLLAELNEAS